MAFSETADLKLQGGLFCIKFIVIALLIMHMNAIKYLENIIPCVIVINLQLHTCISEC